MKRTGLFTLLILSSQLACNLGAPPPTMEPPPTAPLPTWTTQPTFTPAPGPEEINSGTHIYWRETIEAGCEASEDSQGAEYVEKTHDFSEDLGTVTYGGRTYSLVGLHRYLGFNQDDKPLILIYSDIGFDLEVYRPGEDPETTPACLVFRFRLDE